MRPPHARFSGLAASSHMRLWAVSITAASEYKFLVHTGSGIDMTKLIVDGKEIDVPPDYTLLQACEAAGAEIPFFCFHERLSIAGNCRMCLVELKGSPNPVASCPWGGRDCRPGPKGEPPEDVTKTPVGGKAREGGLQFLLTNHRPHCPGGVQGGDCELQGQHVTLVGVS